MPTVIVTLAVLALSACGSGSKVGAVQSAPRLPHAVAAGLAARSDELAAALRRGDACAAETQVHGLERQTRLVLAEGSVPRVYRARLLAAVSRLAARVPRCIPPPPPSPPAVPAPAPPAAAAPPPEPPPAHPREHEHHGPNEPKGPKKQKHPKRHDEGDQG